jgi:pSer/pThr/pTyr-binding forkhead associated (FHA) protein
MKVTVTAIRGPLDGKKFTFDEAGEYLIGRSADCHISIPQRLENLDVSRHHCLLDVDPPVIRIRDLGSRNGTYINGCKVGQRRSDQAADEADLSSCAYCRVVHDDEIRVGATVLRVSVAAAVEPSSGGDGGPEATYHDTVNCAASR